ncbi:MAG: outer membrane protein assembly factor BamD [Alphaproteobacteria bacterium]|nr:outer membrane protein assembly factor BamD [Alphaproteobacteria bacterium]
MVRLIATAILFLGLTACGSDETAEEEDAIPSEPPVEQLYNNAMDSLISGERQIAAQQFEEVERQHPYSVWATKAQLMTAYANYQNGDYGDAIIALDRFIQLHPGNRDVSYAYYLKALSYYRQITDVGRDQRTSEEALVAFQDLVRRFPASRYARDGRHKIDLIVDHLAGKEMEVGRFYQKRGDYLAAINRFKIVVDKYDTTTHVPEALHRLGESYTALGLNENARRVAAVLGYNYPGSTWYFDTYELVEGVEVEGKPEEIDNAGALDWLY